MRKYLIRALGYSALSLAVFTGVIAAVYMVGTRQEFTDMVAHETAALQVIQGMLIDEQDGVIDDLYLFATLKETVGLLRGDAEARETVEYAALTLMRARRIYDQIRVLDRNGMERMRIDYHSGDPVAVADAQLQDKSARYYYLDARDLRPGEVYISPLDLNVEQERIEIPHKPMVRYVLPVYGNGSGVAGYVVMNYLADRISKRLAAMADPTTGEWRLLNEEGFYLFGPDPSELWGFQLPEHAHANLAEKDPELWDLVNKKPSGYLARNGAATFFSRLSATEAASKHLSLLASDGREGGTASGQRDRRWLLLLESDAASWQGSTAVFRGSILIVGIVGVVLLVLVSAILARVIESNKHIREQMNRDATYDELTGAYNRKAGLVLAKALVENAKRTKEKSAIVFLDADNLKGMNDTYGHEMGDAFIVAVADSLRESVRRTDRIIRFGGDEFLVILPNCSTDKASELMDTAGGFLAQKGEAKLPGAGWAFSYGCVPFTGDASENVDGLIAKADVLMYECKKQKYDTPLPGEAKP